MKKREILSTKLKRVVRTGFFNFWRNGTVSLASVLVMTITLSFIGMISFAGALLDTALLELKEKIDVNVTFVTDASEADVLSIKQSLESLPEVRLITYFSREDVLEQFKERHKNDQTVLTALEELGENPLGASLNIKASEPSQYASIAEFLESNSALSKSGLPIIDSVNFYQNRIAIERLSTIISTADRFGLLLSLVLGFISVLIAFNTIRLTIYIAREEIAVMRLVGASMSYIQGPFVIVGIIYGLMASVLTLIIFMPLTYYLGGVTENFFTSFNVFTYYLRNFLEIAFIIITSGVFIGGLSSILAVRKYLKI